MLSRRNSPSCVAIIGGRIFSFLVRGDPLRRGGAAFSSEGFSADWAWLVKDRQLGDERSSTAEARGMIARG